jgi:putrescine transport system permease protein
VIAGKRKRLMPAVLAMGFLLIAVYVFLYAPIFYVIYTSFSADIVWPFPPQFSTQSYSDLFASSLYGAALGNSIVLALGSARPAPSASCVIARAGAGSPCSCSWRRSSWPSS